jgi:anaerobic selenocysteine-containing dehydrogenase
VEVFNDRGSVVCALDVTERTPEGICHSYESCADYEPTGKPGDSPDLGGCINILTPSRFVTKNAHGLAVNSCLVEVRKWREDNGTASEPEA